MRRHDGNRYDSLKRELIGFCDNNTNLPGITSDRVLDVLIKQLIDSIRRVEYIYVSGRRNIDLNRTDPTNEVFDPILAAIYFKKNGNIDEAFWLAFLSVNYGKHKRYGWMMSRDIYGGLNAGIIWTWANVSDNTSEFKQWISANYEYIGGMFGNHRKYESLRPNSARPPGDVVESYVEWAGETKSHSDLIKRCIAEVGSDPREMFHYLYRSMSKVISFGRTSRFDYLTLLTKIGLADIEPGMTYMQNSTGPASGAKLLFYGNANATVKNAVLEMNLQKLEQALSLPKLGMQVLEDALCNWQKNPLSYIYFRG